jgi:hypothetical protein
LCLVWYNVKYFVFYVIKTCVVIYTSTEEVRCCYVFYEDSCFGLFCKCSCSSSLIDCGLWCTWYVCVFWAAVCCVMCVTKTRCDVLMLLCLLWYIFVLLSMLFWCLVFLFWG